MFVELTTAERVTLRQIRQAHPDVSFPAEPSDWSLNALGYAVLERTERPAGDVVTEGVPEAYTLTVTKPEAYAETVMVPQEPIEGPEGNLIEQPDREEEVEHIREAQVEVTRYRQTWQVRAFTTEEHEAELQDARDRQRQRIDDALADALAAGMPYTMPDGSDDTVQMRADDRQNLMGLAIEARDLTAAGETGAVQEFRAASNTRYPMTPDQIIALTDAALGHFKALMARSWDRKDAIDAALAVGDRERLEAVIW